MSNVFKTLEEMQEVFPVYEGRKITNQPQPGDVYNKLTVIYKTKHKKVIYYGCKCDCGKYTAVAGNHLKEGHTKSCGCMVKEVPKANDLTGKKFGKLTVLGRSGTNEYRQATWICECECYNENNEHPRIIVVGSSLSTGKTKSCGCYNKVKSIGVTPVNFKDLTGQVFNNWKVLERAENGPNYSVRWKCECQCDNHTIKIVTGSSLTSGASRSCGCLKNYVGEEKIKEIFNSNNIVFIPQKTFPDCKDKDLLRFDFYMPNQNYLIEYDGNIHFKVTGGRVGTEENFKKTQLHDAIKNQWCKDNNIPLIRIPYTHLENLCLEDLLLETTTFRVV